MEEKIIKMVVEENANDGTKPAFKRDYAPHRRVSIRICVDCGKAYVLPDSEATYYYDKFKTLPLRCESCRERKRNIEDEKNQENK